MKKFLLLTLAVAGLLAQPAKAAITPKEAAEKTYWVKINEGFTYDDGSTKSQPFYTGCNTTPTYSEGEVTLESLNNNLILKLTDFIDASIFPNAADAYAYAKINGENWTVDDNCMSMDICWDYDYYKGYPDCTTFSRTVVYQTGTTVDSKRYVIFPVKDGKYYGEKLFGTIKTLPDGRIEIKTCDFVVFELTFKSGHHFRNNANTTTNSGYYMLDYDNSYSCYGVTYTSYPSNATAKDSEYSINNNLSSKSLLANRTYGVNVEMKNGDITIDNFCNIGRPTKVNRTSQFVVNSTEDIVKGTYNMNDLSVELNSTSTSAIIGNNNIYINYLTGSYNNSTFAPITGSIELGTPSHVGSSKWMNVNDNKTMVSESSLKFDNFLTMYECPYYSSLSFLYDTSVENMTIALNEDIEYTHDLYIKKNAFGYGKISETSEGNHIYLNLNLQDYTNSKFVDHYELYIVPVDYTITPDYNSSDYQEPDKGHFKATRIDLPEYFTYFPNYPSTNALNTLANDEETNPFEGNVYNILVPENDLIAKDESGTGNYAVYVKTYYTSDSGLKPTFNALTSLGSSTVGVEDIINDGADDNDAPAVYYNMNGVQVDGDNFTPGIYIRRQGNTATKIVVK